MLKIIYSLFLGIILAAFVNMGISTFYQAPDITGYGPRTGSLEQGQASRYSQDRKAYNRDVAIITTVLGVAMLFTGISYLKETDVVADGVLLGGIFTLISGIFSAHDAGDEVISFLVVAAAVGAALVLGHKRFTQNPKGPGSKPKTGR